MERINIRVDRRMKQELESEARENGVRLSDIVRQALEDYLLQRMPRQSCLDIAERIGLIAAYKDAPPDLSTNPKYMEGFGRD